MTDHVSEQPADRRRTRPRGWWLYLVVYVLWVVGMLSWMISGFLGQGLRYNAMRHARHAQTVTLQVTQIREHCYKGCAYESIGDYLDPKTHQTVSDTSVIPNFDAPARGPLQVIVSPAHRHEAIRADYTGAGYIAVGITILVLALTVPLVLAAGFVRMRRRRAGVKRTLTAVAAGAQPTGRFEGVLRGPGIPAVIGVSSIELTPEDLVEYEHHLGGEARWRAPLTELSDVQFDVAVDIGTPHPTRWRTLSFRTAAGTYTLTCDPIYLPLLTEAFDRHTADRITTSAAEDNPAGR